MLSDIWWYICILCIKCTSCWHSPHSICQDLQSVAPEYLLPLWAGSVHHFTLMLRIAWKVCCGKTPACKSCILDETCSRWAWALQSGLALIKYKLVLLPYLISCHIHTLSGLIEEKLKWKLWPCSVVQFTAQLGSSIMVLTLPILTWFLQGMHKKIFRVGMKAIDNKIFYWNLHLLIKWKIAWDSVQNKLGYKRLYHYIERIIWHVVYMPHWTFIS